MKVWILYEFQKGQVGIIFQQRLFFKGSYSTLVKI